MHLLPFKPDHLQELADYGGQEWMKALAAEEYLARFMEGPCFSGAVSGEIIGAAGVMPVDGPRGLAWCVLSSRAPLHWRAVHKAVKAFLAEQTRFARVEAYVDPGFTAAVRWVKTLGFEQETPLPMRQFFADGRSALLFAMVRERSSPTTRQSSASASASVLS